MKGTAGRAATAETAGQRRINPGFSQDSDHEQFLLSCGGQKVLTRFSEALTVPPSRAECDLQVSRLMRPIAPGSS